MSSGILKYQSFLTFSKGVIHQPLLPSADLLTEGDKSQISGDTNEHNNEKEYQQLQRDDIKSSLSLPDDLKEIIETEETK